MYSIGKIGVLMPEIADPLDYELLRGIQSEAFSLGYDVIVYCSIFNSQEEYQQDTYTRGLENIFSLVRQHRLDGIIYAAERFHNQSLNLKIQQMLTERGTPCLVLGEERPPLPSFYARQYEGTYRMTKHLTAVHGCRNLYCITGFRNNRTSEERTAGFLRAMHEAGLPVSESSIFYGEFWKEIPKKIAEQIAEGALPMPDGIVCASDSMASAVAQTLRAHGINVPEQIAVTGYDGSWDSWMDSPKLTTVVGRDRQFGADAVRKLYGLMTGSDIGQSSYEQEIRYGESCGCSAAQAGSATIDAHILEQYFRAHISHSIAHKQYFASDLINRIRNPSSLHDWIEAVDRVGHVLENWQWLDICLCEDWCFDLEHPEIYRTEGCSDRMLLALSKRHGINECEQYLFPTAYILPALQVPHEPKMLLLTSLHNHGQIFGYLATAYDKPEHIFADEFYLNWCEAAVNGLDNLQQVMYREYIRTQMELLTVHDPATGLYNRRGFAERLPSALTDLRKNKYTPAILLLTWQTENSRLPYQPLLVLSNALRGSQPDSRLAARIDDSVLAVLYAEEADEENLLTDRIRSQISALLGGAAHTFHLVSNTILIADTPLSDIEKTILQASSVLREQAETAGVDIKDQIQRLRHDIYDRPQENWNVSDIAKQICVSKSHLHRLYKQIFNVNLMDDLILARICKAQKLLEFSELRIQEIAQQCGYNNESHFMRQFKERTGMTALKFRQSKKTE